MHNQPNLLFIMTDHQFIMTDHQRADSLGMVQRLVQTWANKHGDWVTF